MLESWGFSVLSLFVSQTLEQAATPSCLLKSQPTPTHHSTFQLCEDGPAFNHTPVTRGGKCLCGTSIGEAM